MKRMTALLLAILTLMHLFVLPAAAAEPPAVCAESAVLMDQSTGQVMFEKNAHKKLYPASVTKIMSLLLFMEALEEKKLSLDQQIEATAEAVAKGGSQIWLKEGERMTVDELLRATAIGSANDACTALAVQLSGSEGAFVGRMNERAAALGMRDTVFRNCTGLDDDAPDHQSTAYDVALMSRALLGHKKILDYTTVWMDSLRGGKTQLVNTNKLVRFYQGTTGLKTGTTNKAGCCVSASAQRGGLHLIAVIMHAGSSDERFSDAKALLDWGFENFESVTPQIDRALLPPVKVLRGAEDAVLPAMDPVAPLLLSKGEAERLQISVQLADAVAAPVEDRQVLGELAVRLGSRTLATYPLYAKTGVRALTLGDVILRLLSALRVRAA
ncbi:MAG: D-alanyl-D-alanine carboxypeptidase [Clostridia bacterium]|nr:D-alanyl-D-alanine carboxypeptidase [Clostridia bacterium]